MRLKEVGALVDNSLLFSDWYKRLNFEQLVAYVRYQFLATHFRVADPEARAHKICYKKWDGGVDISGVKNKCIWSAIAKEIVKTNAVPGLWVRAHFSPAFLSVRNEESKGMSTVRPEMLKSALSYRVYLEYLETASHYVKQAYEAAQASIVTRYANTEVYNLSPDDHYFYVLCDEAYVNAGPFFRHAFASLENCARAEERYLFLAAAEYDAQQVIYDQVIDESAGSFSWWLSPQLQQEIIRIRQDWSVYNA